MDPFPTKGIEYLLVIGYLMLFVPFAWLLRRTARERVPALNTGTAPRYPGPAGSWFPVPDGFHLHRGHTWAFPQGGGVFKIGMNDFAHRLIGIPTGLRLPQPGQKIRQGENSWQVQVDGAVVDVLSPVHGEVLDVNQEAVQTPAIASEDPYGRGWLLKVRVGSELTALRNLLPARLARAWMDETSEELGALVGGELGPVLQDGGLPVHGFARQLAGDRWPEVAAKFLLTQ